MPIKRANVSEAVATSVRAMIVEGRLAERERINEMRLAQSLGVSRTPLREALGRLSAEGALTSAPSFGYFVRPLTVEEFEQLYDIRPILDPEALRLAGIPPPKRIEQLKKMNRVLATERKPETAIARDDEWHLQLLADCPNRVLIELIEDMMLRTRRYELALFRETRSILRAAKDHEAILRPLRERNLKAACAALKQNMQSGREPILIWLKSRKPTGGRTR